LKSGLPGFSVDEAAGPQAFPSFSITDSEFARFRTLVKELTGIHLTDVKKALVVARLGSRLRIRKLASFTAYHKLLADPNEAAELQMAIDLITTNETSFFREREHFDLIKTFVQELRPIPFPFRVWSAASSSGEEPYSLAMVLSDLLGVSEWEVLGTDISTRVLERAQRGIYPMERSAAIPKDYLHRYCLKGQGNYEGMFLVGKNLKAHTHFRQVNLCKPLPDLGLFDLVFLRNILIYFEVEQKRAVVESILTKMKPHALLVVGHSESLSGLTNRIIPVRTTVYRIA
jgi:chemotaxis protein methyltransferase CheR